MSSKQILIGAATVLLLLAFFIPNLVPIGSSSSSCQGTNCSQNSSSSTSYASLSVSQQTIDLNSSSKASVSFSLTDSVPLNLDIIGLNQFSAIASPNFANSSLIGVLTVSTTSAQPSQWIWSIRIVPSRTQRRPLLLRLLIHRSTLG